MFSLKFDKQNKFYTTILKEKRPLVIFQIITKLDIGGAERVAINIAKSKNQKFRYHIFEVVKGESNFTEKLIEELNNSSVTIHKSKFRNKKIAILLFPFRLFFACQKFTPRVIHSHTEIPDLSIFLFYKIFGVFFKQVFVIRTIHNNQLWNGWQKVGKYVDSYFDRKNTNIVISNSTKDSYQSKHINVLLPVIFNGVEILEYKKFEFLQSNRLNILFAGRFENQKGVEELCEVVNGLKKNKLFHFHIIGEGSLKGFIEIELGDNTNFTIYNKIFNLSQYFNSFDFVFMPSNFEGLALMAIEASLSKTPTIINSAPGLEEIFPNNWPLKVIGNSVPEYLRLFNDVIPNLIENHLGQIAYNHVKDSYGIERMRSEYENYYLKLIQI